jgi:hypothetical protein
LLFRGGWVANRLIVEGGAELEADLHRYPLELLPSASSPSGAARVGDERLLPTTSESGIVQAQPSLPVTHTPEPSSLDLVIRQKEARLAWVKEHIVPAMKRERIFSPYVLAERAGLANDTSYKFLSGERWPHWKTQRAIIKVLGLDPELFPDDPGKVARSKPP